MATITSAGIGSGLDIEGLVSKLVAVERTPIDQLTKKTDTLKTELSSFGQVQSKLSALRDAAAALTNPSTWGGNLATSSDPSAVTVTAGSGAALGNVSVQVNQLATSQTLASTPLATATTTLGQGSLTIQLGSFGTDADTGAATFTPKAGSAAVTVTIGPGQDQLGQVRDQINAANAGVTASIVNDASGSRIVLRSTATGETNGFTVSVSDADGNSGDATGLSALAFDPVAGVSQLVQTLPAQNARAILNGIAVNSESNTLKEAIDGLNITLLKTTTIPPSVTVSQDQAAIKKAISDFTTAYNAVNAFLRDQTKYDAANKTAGTLQGDSTAVGLQAQLRGILGGTTTLAGSVGRLAQIGLEPGSDGNITTTGTKLDTALSNLDSLKKLFMGLDSAGKSSNDGFAQRIRSYVDGALSTDGQLSSRQAGLQTQITNNGKRQATLEDHVANTEKRLRARYTALDTQVGQLNSLSNYVSQQMALLSKG